MYDIFYVSFVGNTDNFNKVKSKYPRTQFVENVKSFDDIKKKSFTKMFWVIWDDVVLDDSFDLNSYKADKWDDMYVHVFKNGEYKDGICLFPKNFEASTKEWDYRYFLNKKEIDIVASVPFTYEQFTFETYEQYQEALKNSKTEMFWGVWPNLTVIDKSIFKIYFSHHNTYDRNENHIFKNSCNGVVSYTSGIVLFSKSKPISKREFDRQFLINKKEYNIIASKSTYPVYTIDSYDRYLEIVQKENSPLFWGVWNNVDLLNSEIFDLYFDPFNGEYDFDRNVNHVFKNACGEKESYLNGVVLFSKNNVISQAEFKRKFLINKKEHDVLVSRFRYPRYNISTYEQYLEIVDNEPSSLFWGIWDNVEIVNENIFDFYFDPLDGKYDVDRITNHVFKNGCGETESYLNGVVLFTTDDKISQSEFKRKFLINKKEHDVLVSRFRYPRYTISTYEQYEEILNAETEPLFWGIWNNVDVIYNKVFDLYFDPNNGKYDFDRSVNHVFKNACGETESYLNGVVLFSKNNVISQSEFKRKFLVDKKEHDILVSRFRYPKYSIDTYTEYEEILKTETSPLFWCVWPEIEVINDSVFDLYFDPNNGKYDFDRNMNHVFLHKFKPGELTYNGVMLMSTNKTVGAKELDFRFLIDKKEHEIVASSHKPYDIVFISYNEPNADENYKNLLKRFPNAKRVHGVKGIHQAHIEAAKLATTNMFWVVDGDAEILETFSFDHPTSRYERDIVHVWRSQNPINGLVYGYGGVKLLPRDLTLKLDVKTPDMTTSISKQFKAVEEISNITVFNTDEFSTWRSAFRECAKLASRVIERQHEEETNNRLEVWCTVGKENKYGDYAISGAIAGREFGRTWKGNQEQLAKINDFEWLRNKFNGI